MVPKAEIVAPKKTKMSAQRWNGWLTVLSLAAGLLLVAAAGGTTPRDSESRLGWDSRCSASKARSLLPVLPAENSEEGAIGLPKGVAKSAPSADLPIDPDEPKALLGYLGPYYNVDHLDGRVVVLQRSVHSSPDAFGILHVTGLIRNQTCDDVRITAVTATFRDGEGRAVDAASAVIPISEVRAGEPVPFIVENARADSRQVAAIEWDVVWEAVGSASSRSFRIDIFEARSVHGRTRYSLAGALQNIGETRVASAHVVAAWLNEAGQVTYVAFPAMRRMEDPARLLKSVDLQNGQTEDFVFVTEDEELVAPLSEGEVAIWGASGE